jgi:acyl-CoA thioesterase-1
MRLITLGDSITAVGPNPCGVGWPTQLTLPLDFFRNAGVGGNVTGRMLERLQRDVLAYKPTDVTIMAGTNDVNRGVAISVSLANLATIIDRVHATGARAWLLTIPPWEGNWGTASIRSIITFNAALRKLAKDHHAKLIDTWEAVAGPDGGWANDLFTCEGVHPTAKGAAAITLAVQRALLPPTVVPTVRHIIAEHR